MNITKLSGLLLAAVLTSQVYAQTEEPAPAPRPLTSITVSEMGDKLLADTVGKTLYTFDPDTNKPVPTCKGDCAEIWPPYLVTAFEAKDIKAPLGTIKRANKQLQVTHNGLPVYTYIFDRIAGHNLGENLGNVWHQIKIQE